MCNVMFKDGLVIVTENVDGIAYAINCSPAELLEDWNGECNFVPENDAPVHFVMFDHEPIDRIAFKNFETLVQYVKDVL